MSRHPLRQVLLVGAVVLAPLAATSQTGALPADPAARRALFARCAPPDGPRHVIINPDWIERPSPQTIAANYPLAARGAGISGRAVVQCIVGVDGLNHDCQVVEENPVGQGFGDAALGLAKQYVMVPMKRDCVPVDGGRVPLETALAISGAIHAV